MTRLSLDWNRLGRYVVRRRIELGWSAKQLAEHAGMSPRLVGEIENGRRTSYSAKTVMALEGALLWQQGSVEDVLVGGEPSLGVARNIRREDAMEFGRDTDARGPHWFASRESQGSRLELRFWPGPGRSIGEVDFATAMIRTSKDVLARTSAEPQEDETKDVSAAGKKMTGGPGGVGPDDEVDDDDLEDV